MFALNYLKQNATQRIRSTANFIWNQNLREQRYAIKSGGNHPTVTMNDLPIPHGCWKEMNTTKQKKYNLILISGILAAGSAIATLVCTDIVNMNGTIPDYPYKTDEEIEMEETPSMEDS